MSTSLRNKLLAVGAVLVAAGALGFIAMGNLEENLVYYWTPSELLARGDQAHGATVRLGGVVQQGSIKWDEQKTHLEFLVGDSMKPGAAAVRVASNQVPPQMFREGIGVVVEGRYEATQTFSADRLMVNHSNEYRAPKDGEHQDLDRLKNTLTDATAGGGR